MKNQLQIAVAVDLVSSTSQPSAIFDTDLSGTIDRTEFLTFMGLQEEGARSQFVLAY